MPPIARATPGGPVVVVVVERSDGEGCWSVVDPPFDKCDESSCVDSVGFASVGELDHCGFVVVCFSPNVCRSVCEFVSRRIVIVVARQGDGGGRSETHRISIHTPEEIRTMLEGCLLVLQSGGRTRLF